MSARDAALGVGNQFIAVLPKSDMVIVNRANTYEGESTPMPELLALVEEVLAARTGAPAEDPALTPLEVTPDPKITHVSEGQLREYVGDWPYPPTPLDLEPEGTIRVTLGDGHLVVHHPFQGTFKLFLHYPLEELPMDFCRSVMAPWNWFPGSRKSGSEHGSLACLTNSLTATPVGRRIMRRVRWTRPCCGPRKPSAAKRVS